MLRPFGHSGLRTVHLVLGVTRRVAGTVDRRATSGPIAISLLKRFRQTSRENLDYANRLIQKLKVARQTVDAQLRNISHQRETSNAAITDALTFAVGDRVLLHNPVVKPGRSRKLTSPWTGPFQVIDSYPNLVNYKVHPLNKNGRLSDNARSRLVHVSRLKRYVDPSTSDIRQGERDSPI